MFARLVAVVALAAFAAAQGSECNTGDISCCQTTYQAEDMHNALSPFGIGILAGVTGLVGSGCSSVSAVGVANSGASCTQQPVCCNGNAFGGLINIGCSPINLHT